MLRLAARNLLRKRVRTVLTLIGLAVAIVLVIGLISFSTGVKVLVQNTLTSVEGLLVLERNAPDPVLSVLPAQVEGELARLPSVDVVVPEIWWAVITVNGLFTFQLGLESGLLVLGSDPERTRRLPGGGLFRRSLREGRFLEPGDDDGVLVSSDVAAKLKLRPGSPVQLGNAPLKVRGTFQTGSLILDRTLIVTLERARRMRQMDRASVSVFYLELKDPRKRHELEARINREHASLRAYTPESANATVAEILRKLDALLLVITILPIAGAGIAILNTMMMSLAERVREFGILKACGWRRRDILRLVLAESCLLGAAGGIAGCAVGTAGTWVLGRYLAVQPVTAPWLVAACLALALGLGMAGGAYPAYRAATLVPMEAMRRE